MTGGLIGILTLYVVICACLTAGCTLIFRGNDVEPYVVHLLMSLHYPSLHLLDFLLNCGEDVFLLEQECISISMYVPSLVFFWFLYEMDTSQEQ